MTLTTPTALHATNSTVNRSREDDLITHIQGDSKVNAIRNNKLVEACYNEIPPEEHCAAAIVLNNIYSYDYEERGEWEAPRLSNVMETVNLGTHILEVAEDQTVTLVDERVAIQLDQDEAYKLLLMLQEVFKRSL